MTTPDADHRTTLAREALPALLYFAAYLAYLCAHPESELMHWLTLVALPLVLVGLLHRLRGRLSWRDLLASFGLRRGNLSRGLLWAALIGLGLGLAQLMLSRRAPDIWTLLVSGRLFYLFPLAFLLMLLTAGFTEEFFFRGVLQTRLAARLRSNVLAVIIVAVLFGLYHVPYAYLNPNWPTHGDLFAAFVSGLGQGGVGGLVLGAVYAWSRSNLLATVMLHALINALPATTMIRMGPG